MRWNFCASGGMFRVQKQRRGERCAHPCAMQSAIQNFQLQFVQLFKSILTLADVLQDSFCMEDTCETQDDIRRMRQLLDGLPARERQIILLRYGLSGQPPLTQLETAKLLDISRSYVSRLETHALELLRQRWDVPSTKTAQR